MTIYGYIKTRVGLAIAYIFHIIWSTDTCTKAMNLVTLQAPGGIWVWTLSILFDYVVI